MEITRVIWWNVPAWLAAALYAGSAAGLGLAAWMLGEHARAWWRARPVAMGRRLAPGRALRRVCVDVLGQRRLFADQAAGWAHCLVFYGFIGLFIGTCLVFLHDKVVPFLFGRVYVVFSFLLEWAGLAFLAGVGWMAWRRTGGRVARLERSAEALGVLALLAAIGTTGFLLEAARIAATWPPFEAWSFVGWTLAHGLWLTGIPPAPLHRILWGAHAALSIAFFAVVGVTTLRHLVVAPIQSALRELRPIGALTPARGETAPLVPERLTWGQLLDASTCVRCGRCTAACPATAAGKPLDPRLVVQKTLRAMREGLPLGTLVSPEEAWSCTTCAACVSACPFEIEVLDKLVDLRRERVEAGEVEPTAARALEAILARGNAWGGAPAERAEWAAGLDLRILGAGEETDLLYWIGCAAAYEPSAQRVARATARLLRVAGVDFAILGAAESCTGDPARRMGEEGCFREAAARVIATLGSVRFRRLLTHCAHCFHVFGNEYPELGARYPVVHHTQLLAELVRAGRLKPRRGIGERVTLHDPCYLARHNGEVQAPRAILAALPGCDLTEMRRSRRETFCCGAGGGGNWVEVREGRRIAAVRMDEARATGARVVATACPFCTLMLEGETAGERMAIRDVAELLWESQPQAGAGGAP